MMCIFVHLLYTFQRILAKHVQHLWKLWDLDLNLK